MSTETQQQTTNGSTPRYNWASQNGHTEPELSLLDRPEVIAALAFIGGFALAMFFRRLGG